MSDKIPTAEEFVKQFKKSNPASGSLTLNQWIAKFCVNLFLMLTLKTKLFNMNKEFVPYEEALAMKELGFDEPCFATFDIGENHLITQDDGSLVRNSEVEYGIAAPLWQQAFRWFMEKHKLVGILDFSGRNVHGFNYWNCKIYNSTNGLVTHINKTHNYHYEENPGSMTPYFENHSYEEAQLECIRELIKIVKDGKDKSMGSPA